MRFHNHSIDVQVGPIDEDLEIERRLVQIEQVLLNPSSDQFF